jgi:hypothetical protein
MRGSTQPSIQPYRFGEGVIALRLTGDLDLGVDPNLGHPEHAVML